MTYSSPNAMADAHRSVRRRSDLDTPYAKVMLGCTAVGSNAYRLKHSYGCVDLEQAADVLKLLRGILADTCSTKVPDDAMKHISSICGEAATSAGLRSGKSAYANVWEQW